MPETMIERAADAAWAHLEKLHEEGKSGSDPAYVSREIGVIDGVVDMPALVRTVLAAMREPTKTMQAAAFREKVSFRSASGMSDIGQVSVENPDDREKGVATLFRAMIDAALAEDGR